MLLAAGVTSITVLIATLKAVLAVAYCHTGQSCRLLQREHASNTNVLSRKPQRFSLKWL